MLESSNDVLLWLREIPIRNDAINDVLNSMYFHDATDQRTSVFDTKFWDMGS
jgi:hypothetical protein